MNTFIIILAVIGGLTVMTGLLTFVLKIFPLIKSLFLTIKYAIAKEVELNKEIIDKKIEIRKEAKLKKLVDSVSDSIKEKVIKEAVQPVAKMVGNVSSNKVEEVNPIKEDILPNQNTNL